MPLKNASEMRLRKLLEPTHQKIMSFKKGDEVRIIDSEKSSPLVYTIKKLKKSWDGTIFYLLKSESNPINLLYYENEKSHLEKAS